jgi:hypothetical protein
VGTQELHDEQLLEVGRTTTTGLLSLDAPASGAAETSLHLATG